ncbi:MAG: hypothetical protein ACOVP6_03805 [Lacibacter sp.]|jgi:hypothetical protein
MNKILTSGLVAALLLLAFAYLSLMLMPILLPYLAEEYYKPVFVNDETRNLLYFVHPVVLAFALAWFWNRFKDLFVGNLFFRGLEFGFVYAIIATIPIMVLIFSAIDVSLAVIGSWVLYGFLQGTIAGLIFARLHV